MSGWPDDLDPASLRQPDGFSCGAAMVVAARCLHDPTYRPADPQREIGEAHRELTDLWHAGRLQAPWPRVLGTPPWALARVLSRLHDRDIDVRLARFSPADAHEALRHRVADRPVGVYVGSAVLPRHVVLAVGSDSMTGSGAVTVFDPARGALLRIPHDRWREHRLPLGRWTHLWAIV